MVVTAQCRTNLPSITTQEKSPWSPKGGFTDNTSPFRVIFPFCTEPALLLRRGAAPRPAQQGAREFAAPIPGHREAHHEAERGGWQPTEVARRRRRRRRRAAAAATAAAAAAARRAPPLLRAARERERARVVPAAAGVREREREPRALRLAPRSTTTTTTTTTRR